MLVSLALVFLMGLLMSSISQYLKLPRIVGMLITGIVLGPYMLNVLDESILLISSDLRKMALVIILIKAGLSLDIGALKKVGRPAFAMSFIPATFEIIAYTLIAPSVFKISALEGAIMGTVLGAVSPAVVVPKMVELMEDGYGNKKGIPQLILAGASLDDIYVILLFTTFLRVSSGEGFSILNMSSLPLSIILGVGLGILAGCILYYIFEWRYFKHSYIRNSTKVIIILGVSFLFVAMEDLLKDGVPFSGYLAVISMACTIQFKSSEIVKNRLGEKFGKLWIAAELILFVLVGAAVDIRYAVEGGIYSVFMIFIALFFRSLGVSLALVGTKLNAKERIFCVIAYLPKATVQAAIGSIPLSMGLACGKLVLSVAVTAILITAPLGALGMESSYKKLLEKD
ncbi:cation:proton antiporter [Anaerosphaera multitolerans]|uniref:Sodium:proton antiporter n=1 Tax=Anaerosphaera multitolerans TaxID=2487351 RepID=A0A437S9H3_9FIRM|nr:cation:proton antiporter [Anaerosphaera multitolerans]RVU55467.1 sodium:proton antiporter [Anaerosphaera multitolerans]